MPKFDDTPGGDTFFARLLRDTEIRTVTIANGQHTSTAFDMRRYTMGFVHVPGTWTAADIGFKVARALAGPYHVTTNIAIGAPATNRAYEFPAALAGAHFVKLWSTDGNGHNTPQGGARTLLVDLKA